MTFRGICILAAAALSPLAAGRALAQSLLGAGGLGVPLEALDARARALGGVGVALFGPTMVPWDPAGAAGAAFPSATATLQPSRASSELAGRTSEASGTRFPLLAVAYPIGSASVATVSYGAFLDLRWSLRRTAAEEFGGQQVPVEDRFTSDGGVAALRVGWAYQLTRRLAVGASAGLYTGQLTRTFTRQVDTVAAGAPVDSFSVRGEWSLTGPTAALGAFWEPAPIVRVAGSLTWSGKLSAEPRETSGEQDRGDFRVPLELRAGASARLTPRLLASLGIAWADWSVTARDLSDNVDAGAAWSMGLGLEWTGGQLLGRTAPLRLGYRWAQLPFRIQGDSPREGTLTAGLGLNLLQVEGGTLARFDAAVERGSRSAGRLDESFWRGTFTIFLSGR